MGKRDDKSPEQSTGADAVPRRPPVKATEPAHAPVVRAPDAPAKKSRAAEPPLVPKPRHTAGAARPAKPQPHAARAAALALLAAVRSGVTLVEAAGMLDPRLSPAERARAQRLAAETLRHLGRSHAVLEPLMNRRPRPDVFDVLTLATTEMLALGEAPHGAVNAAVALARHGAPKVAAASGMINAVLRRAADAGEAWAAAAPSKLPNWLRGPIVAEWGDGVATAIEAAHERAAPLDLTPKPGTLPPGDALPTGSHRVAAGTQVTALSGYDAGDWWIQDAAAALPVKMLAPRPGERIADLCAAPGGKTMQLAAAGAQVTAIDLSPARLERVAQNLKRTGLTATLVAADALQWQPDAPLDAVLLDAPCSATGTIRRHPELPLIRDGSALAELTALQAALIDHAVAMLRPGGRLVYAVCSLLPAEGEAQLTAALARHPEMRVETPDVTGLESDWITDIGGVRLRPDLWADRGGMDGFFIARLVRG